MILVVRTIPYSQYGDGAGPKSEAKKPVKATIILVSDVKVGDKVLRAGEFQVKCDGETIVFSEGDQSRPRLADV
jgi:hypothetical protein